MADNKKYWSNPPDQSVKASISSQLNGTSLVDSNPNKMQRKHQPQQSNSDRRSLNHLPSSESAQSYSTGNQSVNYIKMTNNNRNSIETFHSLNDGNKNYISNSRMNIISSAPLGTSHGSRNCSRNGSRYNLVEAQNANSGTNSYYSYDQYVAQKCTQNKKSESPDAYYEITHANIEKFNQVKDEDKNIDNSKWLEEKPISVLQLDQPDRAVLKIADQRDKIQKKTFTKWINKYLTKQTVKISDLFEDLRDGVCLISLLKALSNTEIPKEKGTTRFHALQNVHRCLDFLEEHNIKLVNIRPDEIVDGNPKLTLGLIWIIILNFQISDIVGKDVIARDALLSWANKHLQPVSIFVQDFSHSWKDGKAFLGILLRHIPEKLNWEQTKFQSNKQRLQLAFTLAEQEFSVTKLLDPEDVDVPQPDERSIITYVSSLYEGLPALKTQQQIEKEKERRGLVQEYSMLFKILSRWLNQSIESINSKYQLPSGFVELKSLIADLKCFRLEEHAVKLKEKKKLASIYVELESYYSKNFPQMVGPDEDIRLVEKLWERLDLAVQTRESELEQAILRSERMQTKYESFVANTSRIDSDLEMLKSQLDLCLRRFNDQNRNKKSVSDELKAHLDRLESQVHVKEQDLRKALIDALQLEEENYPNSSVLIEGLKRTQQTTTALLVTITNAKTSQPNQFLTNLISTNAQYHAQLCETKKLSIISPPNSILDKSSSSNLSTPSQSISTTSSSIQSSNETNNNSIPTTQQILKSSNRLKTTTQYLEITSNATPILPGARPNKQSSPIEHYSPSSINTSCCANVSNNLSKSISLLQKSSSQELLSISDSEIIDLINEAFKWIRIKQAFLDNTKFKPDLCQLQLDLELLYQLKNELAHYRTNIETIELLKMRHVETAELTGLVNQLNFEYRSLCMSAKSVKNNLELLLEYVKLVHEELHFINQMEDVELNRDWSVPAKLNYSELREHRKQVETSLANRQMNYTRILAMAESLVDAKHPAAQDINAYVSALRTGKVWLLELMSILGVHMTYLKVYNKFTKEHNRLDAELTQTGEKFNLLKNSTAYNLSTWNDSLREDFTNQFAQFKRAFQSSKYPEQLDEISALIDKMPSYKLRRSQLKAPFNTAKILTKYSQVEFTIAKDEACRIEDNSDLLKWKVMSLEKNRQAEVPSVCFIIKGPDADLVDLIEKLRFKCNQMDIDIEKFDANLKREKVSKIMQEILNDSKKSSKLQCLSRANIENLIDTVRDEVSSIVNSQRSNEEFSRLLSEFNDFNQSLRQILNMSAGFESTLDQNEELIAMSYFNSLRTSSRPFGSVEQLQTNLDRLYEQFAIIVADVFILHTMTNANNHSIRKNFCLESKFQQFQQTDFRGFEKDLKYAEKLAGSVNNSTSNLSSGFHNSSESPSTGSPEPGLELKSKVTHVKSKYQNLIHLSNLYSKSFSNLDSLSKIVDEFIGDMCQIEIKLASQSLIENVNIDADLIRKEHESLQEVKGLFKAHENDLMVMKSYYEELKTSLEKVRTRNFDQDKFSLSSAEDSPRQKRTDERQSEDLLKLDLLIKQLTDRWNHSLHFYRTRRNNLKDCQRAFEEYQTTVRLEKEYLSSINGEEEEPQVKALERKQSVETCNQKAAQFVQLAKDLNCQTVDYKEQLNEADIRASETSLNSINSSSTDSLVEETNDRSSSEVFSEYITSSENSSKTYNPLQQQQQQVKAANQSLFLQVWNEINELNRNYFELLNDEEEKPIQGDSDRQRTTCNELSLNDIFLSHFSDKFRSDLNLLPTPLEIEPEYTISAALTESEMNTYRDFCGSQEWQCNNNHQKPKRCQSREQVSTKSSHSLPSKTNNNSNSTIEDSSASSSSSFIHNYNNCSVPSKQEATSSTIECELTNFHTSSLISDYRLTLTDLLDLNLVDISNGLIINPINGARLSIADAIRIDLLNSDVKEIANTFLDATNRSVKLTVREAIQLEVLNPFRNEIHLSQTNSKLKLNIYDARKRNMILKPLTLSEAFIRNLIQPNGFVRNPINNKYYAFETLIMADLEQNQAARNKSIMCPFIYDQSIQHYVFDLDTKHIIDPNDTAKKLLSLGEAINIGLIVPRTFELSLTQPHYRRINLYEAFFNSQNLSLSLLLYRPEIDNVYIKLTSNLFNKCEYFANATGKKSALAILLSKRDKIGLIEALNLNVLNLQTMTYATCSETNVNSNVTSILDAVKKYELVDMELLELLNTQIDAKHRTLRDCINDMTIVLEKYLIRHPVKEEYVLFDSYEGKEILSDALTRQIKRLITRINVKSYIISLNQSAPIQPNAIPSRNDKNYESMSMKSTTRVLSQEKLTSIGMKSRTKEVIGQQTKQVQPKQPAPIASFYFGQQDDESPKKVRETQNIPRDSLATLWRSPETTQESAASKAPMFRMQQPVKSYVLDYIYDPSKTRKFTVPEAIRKRFLDVTRGVYYVSPSREISIDQAIRMGYINTKVLDAKTQQPGRNLKPIHQEWPEPNNKKAGSFESSTLAIESVIDAKTGEVFTIGQAIACKILDKYTLNYTNTVTGEVMTLDEAFKSCLAMGKFYEKGKVPKELAEIKTRTVFTKREEKSFQIDGILDPKTKSNVSLEAAIRKGLFDQENGLYINPETGKSMNLNDAVKKGFIAGQFKDNVNANGSNADKNVLYEVNEVEEVMFVTLDGTKKQVLEDKRIEQIIDDEDYDDLPMDLSSPEDPVVKRRMIRYGNLNKNIQERRISSFCDRSSGHPETLVIDDVRQSAMIDIAGVNHVINDETVEIEDPIVMTSTTSSGVERQSSGHSLNKSMSSDEVVARKTSNRSMIVVDDQIFSGVERIDNHSSTTELNTKQAKDEAIKSSQDEPLKIVEVTDQPKQPQPVAKPEPPQLPTLPKPDELEAKTLYDNVRQILENLTEFEFELARQSPLPDTQDSLAKQRADFNQFATRVTEKALFFNGVIDKTKEFSSNPKNETSRLKTDLINYSNEAAYRLKMISTEIEKRQLSLESASIHLAGISNDQTKFQEWFTQAEASFNKLKVEYKDTAVHDLLSLEHFEAEARALEIVLFSHQDDIQFQNQHLKAYATTTDHFSNDLKNFCVKLKNNRVKRLSGEMLSDLETLKHNLQQCEVGIQTMSKQLDTFKAKLVQCIASHAKFNNSCMRLDLWLNEFEPKLKKIASDNVNGNVRKLEDAYKRIQSLQSDVHNKRSELDDIRTNLNEVAAQIDPANYDLTMRSLQAKANALISRYEEAVGTAQAQGEVMLHKLTIVRNMKENVDSTSQWLAELNHTYLNEHSHEQSEEDYERIKADLMSRRDILVKSLSNDSSQNKQLEQLLAKIDSVSKQMEQKAGSQKSLQLKLQAFHSECDRLSAFYATSQAMLSSIDVIHGRVGDESSVSRADCIQRVEALSVRVDSVEKPKIEELNQMLTDAKYKFWPDVLTDMKLKSLQMNVIELEERLGQLASAAQVKIAELQHVHDHSEKWSAIMTGFEGYVNATEGQVLAFEPIAIDIEIVAKQLEQLQSMQKEYEVKSHDLSKMVSFGHQYLGVIAKFTRHQASDSNADDVVTRDLAKLTALYKWLGERFGERKADLAQSLETMKSYLQEMAHAEFKLNEWEHQVLSLFDVEADRMKLKLPVELEALKKLATDSQKLMQANSVSADADLEKLKEKQFLFDRLTNDKNGLEDVKNQLTDLTGKFQDLRTFHEDLNQKLVKFQGTLGNYEQTYSNLKNNLEAKQNQLNVIIGDRASMSIDAELLEQDVQTVKAITDELVPLDSELAALNKLGTYVSENGRDKFLLDTQLAQINENFEAINNDAKITLKVKLELQRLCADFNQKKEEFIGKLSQIDAKLKQLSNPDLLANATEDSAKSIVAELADLEHSQFHECNQTLDAIKVSYNDLYDVAREFLVANGCDSQDMEVTVNLEQTPAKLLGNLESTQTVLQRLKSDFGELLNADKAFDRLLTDLNQFINTKLDQLEQDKGRLSTQQDKLSIKSVAHENSFMCELNRRSEDFGKLVSFHRAKLEELTDQEEMDNTKALIRDLEASWAQLKEQCDVRKEQINACINLSEQFSTDRQLFVTFMEQCENEKSGIVAFDAPNLAELFGTKINKSKELLNNVADSKTLDKCQQSGSELIGACDLDLDVVESQLKEAESRSEALVLDLNEIALVSEKGQADLANFDAKCDEVDANIVQLKKDMAKASATTASKSLSALEEVKSKVAEVPEQIDECKDLAKCLGDKTGNVTDKLNRLDGDYQELDEQIASKVKEATDKMADLREFEANLAKMDEKLSKIQETLDLKQPSSESEPTKPDVIDEASLKAKQVHLDELKESLSGLNDQLKLAEDSLAKASAEDAIELQKSIRILTARSSQLNELQQKEEKEIHEQTELLQSLTSRIVKCNEDIGVCGKSFDSMVSTQKPVESPLTTRATINGIVGEHEAYESEYLAPIKTEVTAINQESASKFNVDVSKPSDLIMSPVNIQSMDVIQMTSLELKLEKLNYSFNKLDTKFKDRAKQLDLALFKSATFEDKLDVLNGHLMDSEERLQSLSKVLFDFSNLNEIDVHLGECDELTASLSLASEEIDEFKEICEKLMQNCDSAEDRDIIEKRMDALIYKWNMQTLQLVEKQANLTFLNCHLKELNESYLSAKAFTGELNLKFTSELVLNCIEPIVMKSTQEKMRDANEVLLQKFEAISELKVDTNNLLAIYEDYEHVRTSQESKDSGNKLIAQLPKTISSTQVFALACMLNKPDIEANVHEIDFKYSDYKFHLGKNLDLMQRLYPLCEKFTQKMALLNQSFAKLDSELEWLTATNANETNQKDKETLFTDLQSIMGQNNDTIEDLERRLSTKIVDELNATPSTKCDEFIEDLDTNIAQVKDKYTRCAEKLAEYAALFEEKKLKVRELFAEMDDLLEWLDDIDAKYTAVEPISHEPEVIKIQLTEQKNLNYETQSQADKLKEITELSKNLIRAKYVEDSIELKEKLTGLQLQSGNLTRQGVARLNELEHALAIAESFYESTKVLEAWFDEVKEELANVDRHHLKETAAGEPKEAIKLELSLLKQVERSLQEKKADFEAMNKNGSALIRLCDKNNGKQQQQEASSIVNKEHQSAVQLRESIQYSNERYDKLKTVVGRRKEELETLLWKSAEFAEKVDDVTSQLNACVELFEYAEPISAHADKLRVQVEDNRLVQADLDKRKQALDDLRDEAINNAADVGRQLFKNNDMLSSITSAASDDGHEAAANAGSLVDQENVEKRIGELDELWYQLKELSEVRASALDEAVRCADTFWSDFHSFMDVVADLEDRLKQVENETVAMDPDSVIEQQQHQEDIIREIDEHEASVQEFRETGAKLMELCGQSDQAEVDKTCEELELAWSRIKQQVRDREIELQQTFGKACEFQQELIEILEWISLQQEKFINLDSSFTSTDPKTIRFQINLLKEFKEQIDPEQLKIELLNQKFDELKMSTRTNQSFDVLASLQEPLNSANKEWKRLQSGIVERKASLQNALLDMGQFNEALDEMLKWVERTDQSLEDMHQTSGSECELITNSRLVSGVDVQLAKLKVLKNDINAQEQSVSKLKETGKNLIRNETTGKQSLQEIKQRVQLLIDSWENLLLKLQEKQSTLQGQLAESRTYACELQDALHWLADTESQLNVNKPTGGLPETAREQLDKFQQLYENIQTNTPTIEALIATGGTLLADNGTTDSSKMTTSQSIVQTVEKVATKWLAVQRKATERLSRLETASRDAQEFHAQLQKFIGWLTETEKELNMNRPVSKLLANINNQIGEHQSLQKNITEHRARMIALDTLGYQLKYHSQKQDVILVKNVLISVQNRWEKIVSRSAERTRDLERGYKESKLFTDNWSELTVWLSEHLDLLNKEQEITVGNNPLKIKQCIAKNKEFHRELSAKQAAYDVVMRLGRKLVDKCEGDAVDKSQLQELLNEAKNKWQSVCFQSTERQKRLEDALLCSGQFREALQSLIEWLGRVEPTLAENTQLNGDLESVLALIEDNQQFQQQLQYKADQVRVVRKAATELLLTSSSQEGAATEDTESLQEQLEEMNELWNRVDEYSRDRTERLDRALKLAKEFNGQVRARLEWLSSAEQLLKFSPPISTDNEQEIIEQIEQHQNFVRDFKDQESLVQQCLNLGKELLDTCTPEAVLNLRHSIAVVQSRFDEINQLSEHKCKRLSDSLSMCKENEELLGELLVWVQGAEATLTAADQVKIVSNLDLIEQLLSDHQEFQTEMQSRQVLVERITKSSVVKDLPDQFDSMKKKSTSIRSLNKGSSNSGWRTPEPRIKNPRVTTLFNRWRKVWLMCMDRQRKLKEALDRQRELERLKNFSFDDWRRRYMNWHKDNRARITDFFRRQDRDHDGKISREEFIEGILSSNFPSSRLELEAVADRFDVDKDGYIDYKEFLATLKPTSNIEPNFERIRDEVQRQVSLCKCSKRYHVLQISDRQYRFGDSQKLRLVRILQSTVMVRVGGGWMALDEFLVKNDPCRGKDIFNEFIKVMNKRPNNSDATAAKGRTNIDLQSSLLLKEITHQHSLDGIYQQKSPGRFVTSMSHHASACAHSNSNNQLKKSTNLRGVGSKSVASVTGNSHRHQPSLIPVSERYMAFEKKTPTSQRSGASSSNSNSKRNPRSDSLSQSNEVLILAASMPSEANSQSGSLGASISDLSSEPTSEFSDGNYSVTNKSSKNGTSTPNGSRLPVFNKKTGVVPANK